VGRRRRGWKVVRGCPGLYRLPSGSLYMRFQVQGQRVSEGLPRGLAVAEGRRIVARRRLEMARRAVGERNDGYVLRELRDDYLIYLARRRRPATVASYAGQLRRVLTWLAAEGCWQVEDLSLLVMERFVRSRERAGVRRRTINLEVQALRRMLEWSIGVWGLVESNPLARWSRLDERADRVRRGAFTEREIRQLLDHWHRVNGALSAGAMQPCRCRDAWMLLADTGLRASDLGRLEWDDVDLVRGVLQVRQGKTASSIRAMPLTGRLLEALGRRLWRLGLARRRGRRVFETRTGRPMGRGLWPKLRRCMRAAGVEPAGRSPHSFRHSFATRLLRAGVVPKTVQGLLGHASSRMTMDVYAHEVEDDRAAAVAALEGGSRC